VTARTRFTTASFAALETRYPVSHVPVACLGRRAMRGWAAGRTAAQDTAVAAAESGLVH
jgi:hypothetical protein